MNIKEGFISYICEGVSKGASFSADSDTQLDDLKIGCSISAEKYGSRLEISVIPQKTVKLTGICIKAPLVINSDDRIYLNGFQTWTQSREYKKDESIYPLNPLAKTVMRQYGDYSFYPYSDKNNLHGWTYSYIKRGNGNIDYIGSLTEQDGYTLFDYNIKSSMLYIKKEIEGLSEGSSAFRAFSLYISSSNEAAASNENDVFDEYFRLLNISSPSVKQCTGWTSWYNYYTGITEEIILSNLNAFKKREIPIDTFQIDDGYQRAVGDWLVVNEKFPNGMGVIAQEIKRAGYKAGLWLAPFICEKRSLIFKQHYDWVLKDQAGKPVKAGINPGWSGIFYALDFYNEDFREYLKEVFSTVYDKWGFDMVKLDFLYAAALIPQNGRPRGRIMHEAMSFLREISGNKIILGCGVPLGPSFGLVDYCRIGSDVALKWEDGFLDRMHYRERVSTANSLASTIGRRHLNGKVFYNDPDVFIIREKNNKLSKEQRNTLFMLNLIFGGLVFTSDNIDEYDSDEMQRYLSLFPFKQKDIKSVTGDFGELVKIDFMIEDKSYTVYSNLGERSYEISLESDCYILNRGFASQNEKINIGAFDSICMLNHMNMLNHTSMLNHKESKYEVAGATGHIFPGSQVSVFEISSEGIKLLPDKNMAADTTVFVKIPRDESNVIINGQTYKAQMINGMNIVSVSFKSDLLKM